MNEASEGDVASVYVDVAHHHLDRPFDYTIPESLADAAVPGVRVRVRFAGRLRSGFIVERKTGTTHSGRLSPLNRVISPEPVFSPSTVALMRAVADHYAGTMADVVRLAVPPRHARAETASHVSPATGSLPPDHESVTTAADSWSAYPRGQGFVDAIRDQGRPRAAWTAQPGMGWPAQLAGVVALAAQSGGGALVVVPDVVDLGLVEAAVSQVCPAGEVVSLHADLGPAERYRRWLRTCRGEVRVVLGTRAAVFAPVADLRLIAVWDDGNDLLAEQRAPYPHAREVALLRAHQEGAGLLLGGRIRTAEAQRLLVTGWAERLDPRPDERRAAAPLVRATGDDSEAERDAGARSARMPALALRTAREALRSGPVLVQVPRRGYVPGLRCSGCGSGARCRVCSGPVGSPTRGSLACRWCGHSETFRCPVCRGSELRATSVGSVRTTEELTRAFPHVEVVHSEAAERLVEVDDTPRVVVSTPGAEPVAHGGYAAALLLDGWAALALPLAAAEQEALRRWMSAAGLVRGREQGGRVVVVADARVRAVQALTRWDPVWAGEVELAERHEARFPPDHRVVEVLGDPAEVDLFVAEVSGATSAEVLGPSAVGADGLVRVLLRAELGLARGLTQACQQAQAHRSRAKRGGSLRVRVDPVDLGW